MAEWSSQIDFAYPLLGFTVDGDVWGFCNEDELTVCGPRTIAEDLPRGMDLFDADGRSWRVLSIERVGPAPFSWTKLFQPKLAIIRYELEARPGPVLTEVQERVCACFKRHPIDWAEFGEDEENLVVLEAAVRQATSVAGVHRLLGANHFGSY